MSLTKSVYTPVVSAAAAADSSSFDGSSDPLGIHSCPVPAAASVSIDRISRIEKENAALKQTVDMLATKLLELEYRFNQLKNNRFCMHAHKDGASKISDRDWAMSFYENMADMLGIRRSCDSQSEHPVVTAEAVASAPIPIPGSSAAAAAAFEVSAPVRSEQTKPKTPMAD